MSREGEYRRECGVYFFYIDGCASWSFYGKSIALGLTFVGGDPYFCVHGVSDKVERWARSVKGSFVDRKMFEEARSVVVVASDHWCVDDLNNVVEDHSLLAEFLERSGAWCGGIVGA